MARIELAPEVFDDFDRFLEHMAQFEVADAPERIGQIILAIQVLTHSPLIGRKVKGGKRELVIGQGARGYIALYRYVTDIDTVFVLALRSQRESGYRFSGGAPHS
jgi:plasmid stabilization system protein ParE